MREKLYKYDFIVLVTSIFALFATVLNPYHLYPGFDVFHNLIVALILTVGLTFAFLSYSGKVKIPYSVFTWILLLFLIIIQPYINNIVYPDYLIFPIGSLLLTIAFSITILGLQSREVFLNRYLLAFIGLMVISVFIQFSQLLGYKLSYNDFVIIAASGPRLSANFLQPNQAAFMLSLSVLGCLYFYNKNKRIIWLIILGFFTIGIALTLSRTGIILGAASIVLFNIFIEQKPFNKVKVITLQLVGYLSFSYIGSILYQKLFNVSGSTSSFTSTVERFSGGPMYDRFSLQEQAWLIFKENPWTGYGWGNFAKGSIEYATELGWFSFSVHSHLFISQIASELGIVGLICLIPLSIFIFKKVSFKMKHSSALCLSAIIIFLLYSSSEFPLWYLRFIIIFAIFITLLDEKYAIVNKKFANYLAVLSLAGVILVSIFITSYLKVYEIIGKLQTEDLSDDKIAFLYDQIPNTFGLSVFREHILFYYISIDSEQISDKLLLAERTVATELNKTNLFRYAKLLAIDHQKEKSLSMFKAACALDWNGECDKVDDELKLLTEIESDLYSEIYYKFSLWKNSFDSSVNR